MSRYIGCFLRYDDNMALIKRFDGSTVSIPKSHLPFFLEEGDIIVERLATHEYFVDHTSTDLRNQEMRRRAGYLVD